MFNENIFQQKLDIKFEKKNDGNIRKEEQPRKIEIKKQKIKNKCKKNRFGCKVLYFCLFVCVVVCVFVSLFV